MRERLMYLLPKPKIKIMFHVFWVLPPGFSRNFSIFRGYIEGQSLYIAGKLGIFPSPRVYVVGDIPSYFPYISSYSFIFSTYLLRFSKVPLTEEMVICRFQVYLPPPWSRDFFQVPYFTPPRVIQNPDFYRGRVVIRGSRIYPRVKF